MKIQIIRIHGTKLNEHWKGNLYHEVLILEKRKKSQISYISSHIKNLEKQEQNKSKASKKYIIKRRAGNNEVEGRKIIKSWNKNLVLWKEQ